jgi:uncharacterized membrane protein
MSRSLKAFITLSVLLNLLLAGLVIGHLGRYFADPHMRRSVEEMAMTLPADKRQHFEEVMGKAEQDTGEWRQQLSDVRKKVIATMKADSFDKKAYLDEMQQAQQLRAKIKQRTIDAIAELAEKSTPEERAQLIEMLHFPPPPPHEE